MAKGKKSKSKTKGKGGGAVLVFANHKGGVAKTTSVANVGPLLADRGHKVVLVDSDPQANLSEAFGVTDDEIAIRLDDLLENPKGTKDAELRSALTGDHRQKKGTLDLIPCTAALASVAAALDDPGGEDLRRMKVITDELRRRYDYVIVDTPPGLGVLANLALVAADWVVIPARPADYDIGGAAKVYDLVELIKDAANPELQVMGVLLVQEDSRWILHRDSFDALEANAMQPIPVQVPFAVRVGSAPRHGAPTAVLEPQSRVTESYRKVAAHIAKNTNGKAA